MTPRRWFNWLNRLPLGTPARRALEETLADGDYERRQTDSIGGRLSRRASTLVALGRAIVATLGIFDEGYPMGNFGRDVRYGLRRLVAAPAFTIFSIVTLALGIGATTAFVALERAATGPARGVRDPSTVINLYHSQGAAGMSMPPMMLSWPDYEDFRQQQTSFEAVAAWCPRAEVLSANGISESAFGEVVDGGYFTVLGVQPSVGRALQAPDDAPGSPAVAVISDRIWRRLFDAAPDVVGRSVLINGHAFEIIGVAPASFSGLFNNGLVPSAAWVSTAQAQAVSTSVSRPLISTDRESRAVMVKGRLKSGRSLDSAQAEVRVIARALDAAFPIGANVSAKYRDSASVSRPWVLERASAVVVNEAQGVVIKPLAYVLLSAVGLVLLVACTNLANLSLARAASRRFDVAVRLALGATRWRLIREAAVESGLVVVAGTVLAVGVARVIVIALSGEVTVGLAVVRLQPVVDVGVFAASVLAALAAFVVAGLAPAIRSTRADVRTALGADTSGAVTRRWRGRQALITLQVAVSLALLTMATVAASGFRAALAHDTGIAVDRMAVGDVDFELQHYDASKIRAVTADVMTRLVAEPGVAGAAAASALPFGVSSSGARAAPTGSPLDAMQGSNPEYLRVTPSTFATWQVPIVNGRGFQDADSAASMPVAVISASLARQLFATTIAVGREIQVQERKYPRPGAPVTRMVIGIAGDTDVGAVGLRRGGTVYVPFAQDEPPQRVLFSVRMSGDPENGVGAIRRAVAGADPSLGVSEAGTAARVTGASNLFLEATAGIAGTLGLFALALVLVGLYGALSHIVASRTREVGIRVSLGASRERILGLIIGDGVRPVLAGLVLGLGLGALARMAAQPIFVRVVPRLDPLVVVVAPILVFVAGVLACYLPARRAAAVDPNVALRQL